MKSFLSYLLPVSMAVAGCAQFPSAERQVGGACEDCALMAAGMPSSLSWKTKLASDDEPGERLLISGTIFKRDGKTPARDVILYVYQTDDKGLYSPGPKQTAAKRHGHLRGWVKTDAQGRYEFSTIRPASYPNSTMPRHIHPIIKEPGVSRYWVDDFVFADDPLLSEKVKSNQLKRGGSGIITPVKNADGVWVGRRDIILGLNIPNY